jgi:hypothetical protein
MVKTGSFPKLSSCLSMKSRRVSNGAEGSGGFKCAKGPDMLMASFVLTILGLYITITASDQRSGSVTDIECKHRHGNSRTCRWHAVVVQVREESKQLLW